MAETTIEWTATRLPDGTVLPGYTFNAWEGCEKVSPGCKHCYAETRDRRLHGGDHWGPDSPRLMHSEAYWRRPLAWNREAAASGIRRKVFCASLSDVFEDRPELVEPRARLFGLVKATPSLDWLLLTKRPENAERLWSRAWADASPFPLDGPPWLPNIWLGTTVEDQRRADERLDHLCAIPAAARFVSAEPLLGPVDVSRWLRCSLCAGRGWVAVGRDSRDWCAGEGCRGIDWVIAGGESGPSARPMRPQWARSLRDQCAAAGVPFLFKQWGEHLPEGQSPLDARIDKRGGGEAGASFYRVGKKAAGRELDNRTHDEFPEARR